MRERFNDAFIPNDVYSMEKKVEKPVPKVVVDEGDIVVEKMKEISFLTLMHRHQH
jgi:hypothetical protein